MTVCIWLWILFLLFLSVVCRFSLKRISEWCLKRGESMDRVWRLTFEKIYKESFWVFIVEKAGAHCRLWLPSSDESFSNRNCSFFCKYRFISVSILSAFFEKNQSSYYNDKNSWLRLFLRLQQKKLMIYSEPALQNNEIGLSRSPKDGDLLSIGLTTTVTIATIFPLVLAWFISPCFTTWTEDLHIYVKVMQIVSGCTECRTFESQ